MTMQPARSQLARIQPARKRALRTAAALAAVGVAWVALAVPALAEAAPQRGPVRDAHTEVELIAEYATVVPGEPITLGLRMRPDDGWHTYWINAGGSGAPTTLEWQLPDGFEAREPRWPTPERHKYFGITNYGYERQIVVPVTINVPERLDDPRVTFVLRADWLTCEEVCIPGSAALAIELPVDDAAAPEPATQWAELFERAHRELPAEPTAAVQAYRDGGRPHLRFAPPPPSPDADDADANADAPVTDAYFFHADTGLLDYDAEQPLTIDRDVHTLALPPARSNVPADAWPERMRGVLVFKHGERTIAWQVNAPLHDGPPGEE